MKIVLFTLFAATVAFVYITGINRNDGSQTPINPSIVTTSAPRLNSPTPQFFEISPEWKNLSDGLDVRSIPYDYNGQSYEFQLVRVNPQYFRLQFKYEKDGKTLNEWKKGVNGVVINSGFFKEENEPVGLLYINGKRIDDHQSALKGTGLLLITNNQVQIIDLSTSSLPPKENLTNALQTFPMLISNGEISADTSLVKEDRRTAIGVDKQKNVYLITAEYPHLSLFSLAQLLKQSEIPFTEVLNLDGGGSTGVAITTDKFQKMISSLTLIPTVLIVEKRQ